MKHLQLFEGYEPHHKFTGDLRRLSEVVWDYKNNPNMGNHTQVIKLKAELLAAPELIQLSQKCLAQNTRHDVIVVYRGGSSEADAGWTTEMSTGLNFAAQHDTDLNVGVVSIGDVLYWDRAFGNQMGSGMDENEVILRRVGGVNVVGSVDVSNILSKLDEDDSYSTLGYVEYEAENEVERRVQQILDREELADKVIPFGV